MISLALCLSLVSYASAQSIVMVPVPSGLMGPGYVAPSDTSSSYSGAPPAVTSTPSYSNNQYGSYSAPPAQYTPPPQTAEMPYSAFMAGGYKSMDCGYGYQKGSDGSCTSTQSWVRILPLSFYVSLSRLPVVFVWLLPTVTVVSTFYRFGRELKAYLRFPQLLSGTPSHRHLHHDGDDDNDGYQDDDGHDDSGSFLVRD